MGSGGRELRVLTCSERRSAQARALEERGKEYILPIQIEGAQRQAERVPAFGQCFGVRLNIKVFFKLIVRRVQTKTVM